MADLSRATIMLNSVLVFVGVGPLIGMIGMLTYAQVGPIWPLFFLFVFPVMFAYQVGVQAAMIAGLIFGMTMSSSLRWRKAQTSRIQVGIVIALGALSGYVGFCLQAVPENFHLEDCTSPGAIFVGCLPGVLCGLIVHLTLEWHNS